MTMADLLRWDLISGMPLPHISFILRHFLPMAYSNKEKLDILQKAAEREFTAEGAHIMATGSSAECLNLPALLVKNKEGKFVGMIQSDVDLMMVGYKKPVGEDPKTASYLICTEGIHPGYTLLEIVKPEDTSQSLKSRLTETSPYYLNAFNCTLVMQNEVDLDPGMAIEIHGPAVTYYIDVEDFKSLNVKGESDAVHGLTVPQWPSVANEWQMRGRKSGWPPKEIIEDVVSKGCHVVGTGHAHSAHRDLEWRFSFSYAEVVLTSNLSSVQKQCYLLFKTLHLCAFKHPQGIVSYHLKTLLLWAAEEIPQAMWTEDTVGSMLTYLLDKLLYCLIQHNLPNYFIPSNNLLDAIPTEIVSVLKKKVTRARRDPVQLLLKLNKQYKYFFGPLFIDMEEIMRPILEDIPKATLLKETFLGPFIIVAKHLARCHVAEYMELKNSKDVPQLLKEDESYTLPFEHAIGIHIDIARMAKNIINHKVHPAEILMSFVTGFSDKDIVKRLLNQMYLQFPDAPNRDDIIRQLGMFSKTN